MLMRFDTTTRRDLHDLSYTSARRQPDHPEYRDSFDVGLHDGSGRPFVLQVSLHPDAVSSK